MSSQIHFGLTLNFFIILFVIICFIAIVIQLFTALNSLALAVAEKLHGE